MDTVPYILGIAHPPGYPLYTLLGWVWTHVFPFGAVAWRMSLLSACAMAACVWCVDRIVLDETGDANAAWLAAGLFAVSPPLFDHATYAEPHAFATLAFLLTLLFLLRWHSSKSDAQLYGAAIAFGFGVAIHPIVALMLPGIIVLIVARLHETPLPPIRRAAVLAAIAALVWFAYFPLRSAYVTSQQLDPAAALGVVGGAFWDYGHPLVASNLFGLVTGRDVDVSSGFFGYTSPRFPQGVVDALFLVFRSTAFIGLIAAIYGAVRVARSDGMKLIGLLVCVAASFVFACGFSDEVDISRYFLPALALVAVLSGLGFSALRSSRARIVVAPLVILGIAGLLFVNRNLFVRQHDDRAERDVDLVLAATPSDAILVANWTVAPPLAYASYVEHRTDQRVVVAAWPAEVEDLIPAWSQRRPVYVIERSPSHVRIHRVTH